MGSDSQPDGRERVVSDAQVLPRGPQGQGVTPSAGSPNVQVPARTQPVSVPVKAANILGGIELILIAIVATVCCSITVSFAAEKVHRCLYGGDCGVEDIYDSVESAVEELEHKGQLNA